MCSKDRRTTERKRIIDRLLSHHFTGRMALLEELRWMTFIEEQGSDVQSLLMSRSYMNSFSRTMREQIYGYNIYKLYRPDRIQSGIAARAAIYRLRDYKTLKDFLDGKASCILCETSKSWDPTRKASLPAKPKFVVMILLNKIPIN
jgi:hypothetical protein